MPNQPYYPEQVRFLHQQNCKDSIIFFNKSDTLFKTYRWIFNNIDSVDGDSVKYAFAHSGKYLVTLKAFSRYGYMRQLTDTVLFYKKPKAKMYFKDSLGCQWVAFSYKDSSKNDTLNPNQTTLKWLWDFGDGTTDSLQNINHIYTKSGVYNVKLKIDNGFCSDSQTMVNKVNILSAPKPGFTLDKTIECIPPATAFIANDTLTELVTKKTYRFADSLPDNNINITQHTVQYLYTAKGKYNITQTLYSPSGCVSKDSQYVQVFGSLAAFKPSSPNITINNNDMVELWWNKNVDTKNYLLYKATNYTSLSLYKNQSDTFIIDSSAQNIYTSTYQYALQLTDNCGQISPTSDTETSILLTGKNNHNVYGLFNWNNITATTNNFTLKKWRGFDTIYINNISTSPYYDNDFYNDTVQQSTSYQIQTLNNRGYHISSNKTYLGYEPVVIIPTLYDVIVYPNGVPVIAFYIKHFDIEIYDLLGRNVFTGSDIKGWYNGDGGAQYFIYRITGTTKDDKPFNQSGKILLLK